MAKKKRFELVAYESGADWHDRSLMAPIEAIQVVISTPIEAATVAEAEKAIRDAMGSDLFGEIKIQPKKGVLLDVKKKKTCFDFQVGYKRKTWYLRLRMRADTAISVQAIERRLDALNGVNG